MARSGNSPQLRFGTENRRLPEKRSFSHLLGGDQAVSQPSQEPRYDLGALEDNLAVAEAVEQPRQHQ